MTSTTTQPTTYTYARPSTSATRALIDSTNPSPTISGTATPSDPEAPHATLHRRKTNNYESALADRLHSSFPNTSETSTSYPDISIPDTSSSSTHTAAHHNAPSHNSSPLNPTTHEDSKASVPPTVVGSVAYKGDAAASATPGSAPARPGIGGALGRQQSWKQGDQRRANMEKLLSSEGKKGAGGYSSGGQETVV